MAIALAVDGGRVTIAPAARHRDHPAVRRRTAHRRDRPDSRSLPHRRLSTSPLPDAGRITDSPLPPRLDSLLRDAHPAGVYEKIDPRAMDRHLGPGELERLMGAIGAVPGARAGISVVTEAWERSHRVFVGTSAAPTHGELTVSGQDRVPIIRQHGGSIVYWIVHLSRVGPYWTAYWNDWREKDGRLDPGMSAPESPEWAAIVGRVTAILAERGWREVGAELLDVHLPWLTTLSADTLVARGASPHPTVRDALFEDEIC